MMTDRIHRRSFLKIEALGLARLASRALLAQGRTMLAASTPGHPATPIRFENKQTRSGVGFVLNNGTIPDKPIIDSMLGGSRF
jgi:hypothetical protein